MISALLALILSIGPGGSFGSARRQLMPGSMAANFEVTDVVGTPSTTYKVERGGILTGIHGEAKTAGIGPSTLTLSVTADGETKCTIVVACTESDDFFGNCDATFDAGQDLHLVITASTCITKPRLLARAAWLW